jgi:hypothetical protein
MPTHIPVLFNVFFEHEIHLSDKSEVNISFDKEKCILKLKNSSAVLEEFISDFAEQNHLEYKSEAWVTIQLENDTEKIKFLEENLIHGKILTVECVPDIVVEKGNITVTFSCLRTAYSSFRGVWDNKFPKCMNKKE